MSEEELIIHVLGPVVPTTAAPFHPSASHVDALGMPVAFGEKEYPEGIERWSWHPTPCCGACATATGDGDIVCKACFHDVDPAYGNAPVEPLRPIPGR
jgi:hypothetical protein